MILKEDHDVRTASDGDTALREVERLQPDLVFLDIRMPGMSGTEVMKAVKTRHPDVQVAIVTAYAGVESARMAVQFGAIDYLTKPYSVGDVERIVEKALKVRRQRYEAGILSAQLAKVTEALTSRTAAGGVGGALDSLRSLQTSVTEDLAPLSKLGEWGEVAAEVTHDIDNLLAVIMVSSQFLMRQVESHAETDPKVLGERVQGIARAAEDCLKMIRQIRDFTRPGSDQEMSSIDVNTLVSGAVDLERDEVSAQGDVVEYRLRLGPVPLVRGDETALRRVLVNLIENARDALGGQGYIELSTRLVDGYVQVQVRDNGCGMPPEVLEKATTPFFSTKRAHGTGLGLAITDGVIKRHNGRMALESAEGEGTTITIELPVVVEAAGETQPRTRGTVVVVEDEEAMLKLMAAILESEGYRVLMAENGAVGWDLFQQNYDPQAEEPFLVITDREMPDMSGRELTGRIKKTDPDAAVLVVSGYSTDPSGPEDALVRKPFGIHEFVRAVADLMHKQKSNGQ
jgi:signal transduction histidine kinase